MSWEQLSSVTFFAAAVCAVFALLIPRSDARSVRTIRLGLVAACLGLLALAIFGRPVVGQRQTSDLEYCSNQLRNLSQSLLAYAYDSDGRLPPSGKWAEASLAKQPTREEFPLICPKGRTPFSYAFNRRLDHYALDEIADPADTVTLFEMNSRDMNGTGGEADVAWDRHYRVGFIFSDGHLHRGGREEDLTWNP